MTSSLRPSVPRRPAQNLLFGLVVAALLACAAGASEVRERLDFDAGWRFRKTDDAPWTSSQLDYAVLRPWLLAASADLLGPLAPRSAPPAAAPAGPVDQAQPDFDDSSWRQLDLPHDWGVEGAFHQEYPGETGKLAWWGVAWYRKKFTLPAADAGRRLALEIDGAMAYSTVWVNGHLAGGWPSGYTSYAVDLTPYLTFGGENVVAIRLDNPPDSSRWYPGGGLYRNVWLVKTGAVRVPRDGVFVTTPRVTTTTAVVSVNVLVENLTATDLDATVGTELFAADAAGRPAGTAFATKPAHAARLSAGSQSSTTQMFEVASPRLWSIEQPQRCVAVTTVRAGDRVVDRLETVFGIRSAAFDSDHGFLLNGRRVPLLGVCLHHDLGALGAAINVRALERRLELLKAMGCNAIRTSHNPPAPELLDLCDRLGFVVMDEAFDCWTRGKTRNDYHLLFADWHERDLRAFVRRDRNHPSVVLWSIGNEVHEQRDPGGWKIGATLAAIMREEDRTRPVSSGLDGADSPDRGLVLVQDAVGYNYKPGQYARFHADYPTVPVFGSETASTISSRGEYFFPVPDDRLDRRSRVDFQVSSYDLSAEQWATTPETEWAGQDAGDFVAGEFVWTGFDYLGEPSPYVRDSTDPLNFSDPARAAAASAELRDTGLIQVPSRSSYFGLIDLAGFPKDRFYLYQARWRPELPMVHLLPHWTWPGREGQITPVHVYTTGDEAELFLNSRSLGRKRKAPGASRLRWDDVPYEPGELKVVAYRHGARWAEAATRTAGAAATIELAPDRSTLAADGRDLSFVSVAIRDAAGELVPRAANLVRFTVTGPAVIAAVDNGDATSHEPFQASQHRTYNGRALVIVRPVAGRTGPISLRAEADGLPATVVSLESR